MLAPSMLLTDNGSGRDTIVVYAYGTDPVADADDEGNWRKRARPTGRTFPAIVEPSLAVEMSANGQPLSMTSYLVMVITDVDPGIPVESQIGWAGMTLTAQGDAIRAAGGAYVFQAVKAGTGPEGASPPYGLPA